MKIERLQYNESPKLLLIFGGWGSGPSLFGREWLPKDRDVVLFYDYSTIPTKESLAQIVKGYELVSVVAWSLGVWMANRVLYDYRELPIERAIAVGGTVLPIDDNYGIPKGIFEGTLKGLSPISLQKFRRRMCGVNLQDFLNHLPDRDFDNLKLELEYLYQIITSADYTPSPLWSEAYLGKGDYIFPMENQQAFWEGYKKGVNGSLTIQCHNGAHYDPILFQEILISI